jgi:hypothetical protein
LDILRFPPRAPNFRPCISRGVKLGPGDYMLGAYLVSTRHRTDPDLHSDLIHIRARGWYNWEACRGWNDDEYPWDRYEVRTTLLGHGFFHTVLNDFAPDPTAPRTRRHIYGNGNYEWGGRIVRYTPGVTEPQR